MKFELIKIVVTIILAISGWMIGLHVNSKRARNQKRRDISIDHLINGYRILTNEISHRSETPERARKLEHILSGIQLFGSAHQVELARSLSEETMPGTTRLTRNSQRLRCAAEVLSMEIWIPV